MRNITLCDEMKKLRKALDARGIPWDDCSSVDSEDKISRNIALGISAYFSGTTIYRTHFQYKDHMYSTINGYGTYGGYSPHTGKNDGLLEVYIDWDEVTGWLTADGVLAMLDNGKD